MFSLSSKVEIDGRSYEIRTDFRVFHEIFVMLDDPDLTDADKTEALLRMFYVRREASPDGNQPDDIEEALEPFEVRGEVQPEIKKYRERLLPPGAY